MNTTFTPLVPPALPALPPGTAPLRTKVLSPPVFHPISSSAPTACHTHLPPAVTSTSDAPANTHTLPTPTVTYLQENGQITRIRIQCPCGSIVELECVY